MIAQSERQFRPSSRRLGPGNQNGADQIDRRDFLRYISLLPILPLLKRVDCHRLGQGREKANVIILVFDALSACHLSLYGYQRETTPNLARFARRAVVYHNHYAGGNFTIPGTAALLTGTYPWKNRAFNSGGRIEKAYQQKNIFKLLSDDYNNIAFPHNRYAHLLLNQMAAGIDTYLHPTTFSLSHGEVYPQVPAGDVRIADRALEDLLLPTFGLPGSLFFALAYRIRDLHRERSDLEEFDPLYPRGIPALNAYNAHFLVEDVMTGMTSELTEKRHPLLAYLHFYPPHDPYRARREFVDIFRDGWEPRAKREHVFSQGHPQEHLNEQRTWYDEYIAHMDAEFGRMCDSLNRSGLMDTSYVIFTSDHGELFERGVRGHLTPLLYEPLIRVPLLISAPGQSQRRDIHVPTSCVDLLPTLLHLTGQSVPDWCEGQLLPELGGERDEGHVIFSVEAKESAVNHPLTKATVAMIRGTYKLIHYFGYRDYQKEYELYNLENDPAELENLYSPTNPVATDMQNWLELKLQEVNRPYQ